MITGYIDFWIKIAPKDERAFTAQAHSIVGDAQGDFTFPFSYDELLNIKHDLEKAILGQGRTRAAMSAEVRQLMDFGGRLFEALPETVRSRYHAALDHADTQGYDGVRIRLTIVDQRIAVLPWELLYDPERKEFIGLSSRTPIVRYLELPRPRLLPTFSLPLRVLVVISAPQDTAPLDGAEEKRHIQKSLGDLGENFITIHWLDYASTQRPVSIGELQHALFDFKPHVLHFVGHGKFDDRNDKGFLLFEQEAARRAERVNGMRLAQLASDTQTLQLIVLNACEGAQTSEIDDSADIARALVQRGFAAVIAMQFEISDQAAIAFASEFYRSFARQPIVDKAVQEGRKRIGVVLNNSVEWATPVLFLRAEDGQLFRWGKGSSVESMTDLDRQSHLDLYREVTESEQTGRPELRFANREDELQTLLKPIHNPGAPRYLEICAPTGFGKTYLLNEAREKYTREGWLCASIDFFGRRELRENETLLLLEIGDQLVKRRVATPADLAVCLQGRRQKQQSVIFLDAVELASNEVRRWIKTELISTLEEHVTNPRLRPYIISASKYPIPEWSVYSRQRFTILKLTPFTEDVVDQLLRELARAEEQDLPDSTLREMVKTTLWVSKGHPRCIREILRVVKEKNFALPPTNLAHPTMLGRVIGPVIKDEILSGVRDNLKQTFRMLCVLRGYAPNILDRLETSGAIPRREFFNWDLEAELLNTHLVDPPNSSPLYCFEPLIRQIIALYEETKEPETFWKLNNLALAVYEEQIMGVDAQGAPLPQTACDRPQVTYIVEALFHSVRDLSQQRTSKEGAKQQLLQALNRYLAYWRTEQSKKYWADLLLSALEHDDELKGLVYESVDDYDFLLKPVRQLKQVETKES